MLKTTMSNVAALTPLLAASGVALAGGDGGIPFEKIGLHALNLVILLGVLGFVTRKLVRNGLIRRAANIREAIEASDRAQAAARERYAALETRLAGLEGQLATMRQEAETEAAAERALLIEKADIEAAALRANVARTVQAEAERARQRLRRHAAELAVQLAADQVVGSITDDDHVRLTRAFLASVQEGSEVSHG
ncbi:MAG: ATP synthase F0 subunit B [Myxococcota bacterium]|nr:ATP synthase F0 subunit B [Myxococcota bacterium]